MDVSELTSQANELLKEEFVNRHTCLFLLFHEERGGISPAQFSTQVVPRKEAQKRPGGALRVLPVTKAPANPYSDRISIGRARNCDVVLRDPSVSKLHAHFRVLPDGKLELVDLDSQNGTCVNHAPLAGNRPEPIKAGDLVLFGAVSARLVTSSQVYDLLR